MPLATSYVILIDQDLPTDNTKSFFQVLGMVNKCAFDCNGLAQEKGLEAVLAFVEKCDIAGKTVNEVINGLISNCLAARRAKTKDLAKEVWTT